MTMKKTETDTVEQQIHAVDPQANGRIIRKANLRAIELVGSHFDVSPLWRQAPVEERELSLNDMRGAVSYDAKVGVLVIVHVWNVLARHAKHDIVSIEASYAVVFSDLVEETEQDVVASLGSVVRLGSYPHFRALTAMVFSQGNVDLPILPLVKSGPPGSGVTTPTPPGPAVVADSEGVGPSVVAPGAPSKEAPRPARRRSRAK